MCGLTKQPLTLKKIICLFEKNTTKHYAHTTYKYFIWNAYRHYIQCIIYGICLNAIADVSFLNVGIGVDGLERDWRNFFSRQNWNDFGTKNMTPIYCLRGGSPENDIFDFAPVVRLREILLLMRAHYIQISTIQNLVNFFFWYHICWCAGLVTLYLEFKKKCCLCVSFWYVWH